MTTPHEELEALSARIASSLWRAAIDVTPIDPPTTSGIPLDVDTAYRIQDLLVDLAVEAGARRVGYKVALTSVPSQQVLDASEPAYGVLVDRMLHEGGVSLERARFVRPRIESEVAVRICRPLAASPSVHDARDAIDGIRPAIEIADARLHGRFSVADCVADNAFAAAVVLGGDGWHPLHELDLAGIEATLEVPNNDPVHGRGDMVLGDPLASVAWLASALTRRTGTGLRPGDVVLTGSLTAPASLVGPGPVDARFTGLGDASLTFV